MQINNYKQAGPNNESAVQRERIQKLPDGDPYDTLVLSGGSVNGITTLGALQYMWDHNKLKNIKKYYGTSVGSIISYLLIIGYEPVEILLNIISEKLIDYFRKINVIDIVKGNGGFSWQPIDDFLLELTLTKCEQPMSFEDIYKRYNVNLTCCTYNLSKQKIEILSYETHPTLLCTAAIRMSCNIPLLFPRYKYLGDYYIDGGVVDNFPIGLVDPKNVVFGINLSVKPNLTNFDDPINESNEPKQHNAAIRDQSEGELTEGYEEVCVEEGVFSLQDYITSIFTTPIQYHIQNKIQAFNERSESVDSQLLTISTLKIALNFNLTTNDQLEMFSHGYQYLKTYGS
jgi:predicted acylesterase/phospholipase RssA